MKLSIKWHKDALANAQRYLGQELGRLERMQADVDRLKASCQTLDEQIKLAEAQGLTGFDVDKFGKKKEKTVKMKYVMLEDAIPVLFPDWIDHDTMTKLGREITSAGFCFVVVSKDGVLEVGVSGRSVGLGMEPVCEDAHADYDNFAWLYNKEWAAFGENIFPALKTIAGDKLPEGAKILDLCCGTGQLAKVLIEKGYRVTGIDGSAEMLRYAKENAPDAEFIPEDARNFRLPPVYNAVFSTFDALNHVMDIGELQAVFKNVNECLVNGGIFIFDMTTRNHFETNMQSFSQVQEKPDYLYIMRGEYNRENKTGEIRCTIFQPTGKNWKRNDIFLCQTWYPCEDIKSALEMAGFTGIRTHSFNQQREPVAVTEDTLRVFFYAQKP